METKRRAIEATVGHRLAQIPLPLQPLRALREAAGIRPKFSSRREHRGRKGKQESEGHTLFLYREVNSKRERNLRGNACVHWALCVFGCKRRQALSSRKGRQGRKVQRTRVSRIDTDFSIREMLRSQKKAFQTTKGTKHTNCYNDCLKIGDTENYKKLHYRY